MKESKDKKTEIMLAAEKLFSEQGFDGTSVRDIASTANVNVAMISYYFGSKEKMLEAIVLNRIEAFSIQLENVYQENISPLEKMNKWIAMYIKRIYDYQCIYMIMHIELATHKRTLNHDVFTGAKKNNLQILDNIIAEGQKQGLFKKDVETALIQPTIMGTLTHILLSKHFYMDLMGLQNEEDFTKYILTTLTEHIQKTIQALLQYEK